MTLSERIARIRKAIVSLVGFLTSLLTLNLLPDPIAGWVAGAVGFLTVLLTYWVPNTPPPVAGAVLPSQRTPGPDHAA